MSRAEWYERTGDKAFVDRLFDLVGRIVPAAQAVAEAGRPVDDATVPGLPAIRGALDTLRAAAAKAAADQPAAAAKLALTEELRAALDDLVAETAPAGPPPADAAEAGALLGAVVAGIGPALAGPAPEMAEEMAGTVAARLSAATPEERRAMLAAGWEPAGLAQVFGRLPPEALAAAVQDLVAAVPDRASLLSACEAALAQEAEAAADPGGLLRPGGVAGTLLLALHGTGDGAAYLRAVAAAYGEATGMAALLRTLEGLPLPSEVSRPLATLYGLANARFGDGVALALVRGHLLFRLIGPAVPAAGELPGEGTAEGEAADRLAGYAVAAGLLANEVVLEGEDPDSLVVQRGGALASEADLLATFAAPTPPDPLGTLPAIPITQLGVAIAKARQGRRAGYDWAAVQALAESDPDGYGVLLTEERCEVLDGVLAVAGLGEPVPAP